MTGVLVGAHRGKASSAAIEKARATVEPLPEPDATETLDVTVTNNDGTSNKVPSDADVV